jgi:hypothetical protein
MCTYIRLPRTPFVVIVPLAIVLYIIAACALLLCALLLQLRFLLCVALQLSCRCMYLLLRVYAAAVLRLRCTHIIARELLLHAYRRCLRICCDAILLQCYVCIALQV